MSVLRLIAIRWVTFSAGLAVGAVFAPALANASVAQGFVSGVGTVTDDFGDEGPIDHDSNRHSNATLMWQKILQADGYYLGQPLDCDFGPATTEATKAWQRDRGLADGSAGPMTLGRADDKRQDLGSDGAPELHNIAYRGSVSTAFFLRSDINGEYGIRRDNGPWFADEYKSASACDS